MANTCYNNLIVLGLEEPPQTFTKKLEISLYGAVPDSHYAVEVVEFRHVKFRFRTKWAPPVSDLIKLSRKMERQTFLLEYRCWESGFRGQMVIRAGRCLEDVHRCGYDGPDYLWADITNPVVDLVDPYLNNPTLAQHARARVHDAIQIVRGVKEVLEDSRFTGSHYRALGDPNKVKETLGQLQTLLDKMTESQAQIDFSGVFVEASDFASTSR
jgi:hypothetical protein